jgi:glycosyltransferase involved in cell wall biosynthesis
MIELERHPGKLHPKPLRPGVDMDTFKFRDSEEKKALKKKWGINEDIPIILLVQRNQARKRISEVMTAFARMKSLFPDNHYVQKAILLMHTAWPDNSMSIDFPRAIARLQRGYHGVPEKRKGIISEVCSTFMCRHEPCQDIFVAPSINLLQGQRVQNGIFVRCPKCGNMSASTPNTGAGLTREDLSEVYGMADMMVQMSIAEGCGMPVQEAKACGVPVLVTDYAAISEKGKLPDYEHIDRENYTVHKGGETMDVAYLYEEPETTCWRAMTSIDDCAEKMGKMIGDPERRAVMSKEARECVETNYDWDKNWKEWEFILDKIKLLDRETTWDKPAKLIQIDTTNPDPSLSDEDFVVWCYTKLLGYEDRHSIDDAGLRNWMQKLQIEASRGIPAQRSRDEIVKFFRNEAEKVNQVERMRAGVAADAPSVEPKDPDSIEAMIV